MKPAELEIRYNSKWILEQTSRLIHDMVPLIDDVLWECVKEIKWMHRI